MCFFTKLGYIVVEYNKVCRLMLPVGKIISIMEAN